MKDDLFLPVFLAVLFAMWIVAPGPAIRASSEYLCFNWNKPCDVRNVRVLKKVDRCIFRQRRVSLRLHNIRPERLDMSQGY
jgi:hypothetical protein